MSAASARWARSSRSSARSPPQWAAPTCAPVANAHAVGDAVGARAIGVREQREQVAVVPVREHVGAAQHGGEALPVRALHEQHGELVAVANTGRDHASQHPAAERGGERADQVVEVHHVLKRQFRA